MKNMIATVALLLSVPVLTSAYGGGSSFPFGVSVPNSTPAPQVEGATCEVYVTDYIWAGKNNNPEQVKKLQEFLNKEFGISLEVNGVYNEATVARVKQFQLKYWEQILLPWVSQGLTSDHTATGNVYKTTLRMINLLACPANESPMPQLP